MGLGALARIGRQIRKETSYAPASGTSFTKRMVNLFVGTKGSDHLVFELIQFVR